MWGTIHENYPYLEVALEEAIEELGLNGYDSLFRYALFLRVLPKIHRERLPLESIKPFANRKLHRAYQAM